jgi:hypothetical protein
MRLTDHVTLNFKNNNNNNICDCGIFGYRKINSIKLISSFLCNRKFRVTVEGELSTPREIHAGVPQNSVLAPTLYSLYINDAPQTPGVHLALFADDRCTDRKENCVLRKLHRGLTTATEA